MRFSRLLSPTVVTSLLCRSWAALGQAGSSHVNNHRNEYVIETFSKLGYKYLAATSNKLRGNRGTGKKSGKEDGMPEVLSENYPWFRRSIMVFKRQTPIVGLGCTPKWAKKVGLSGS